MSPRLVRASLASVPIALALLALDAPRVHAQGAGMREMQEVQIPRLAPLARDDRAQRAAPDTSQCDLIDADRPGIADGSHVIGAGQLQLETAYQQERRRDADLRSRLSYAPTLLRLGLSPWVEARLESNTYNRERLSLDDGSASTTNTGFSPLFLGAKVVLFDPTQSGPLQVATIVRIAPPSGSGDFNSDRTTGDVRVVADWQFAPTLSLNPNVGYGSYEGSDGSRVHTALGALTLSYQPTKRLNPFIDVDFTSREDAGGTWSMIGDLGAAYIIGCDLQLDVSVGQNLHGVTAPKPFVAAGISVRADLFHRAAHPLEHFHGDRPAQSARR